MCSAISCFERFTISKSCNRYKLTTSRREQSLTIALTLLSCLVALRLLLLRVINDVPSKRYNEIRLIFAIAELRKYCVSSLTFDFETLDVRDQSAYDASDIWRHRHRYITIVEFNQLI